MDGSEKIAGVVVLIFIILFFFPVKEFKDCTDGYRRECRECHLQNMSYAICSGFCIDADYKNTGCEADLHQSCNESIRDGWGCVSESYLLKFGVLKLWGQDYYYYSRWDNYHGGTLIQFILLILIGSSMWYVFKYY